MRVKGTNEQVEQAKNRVIKCASAMFHMRGIKDVKMDEIPASLSMSKRTIYELFKDKETYKGLFDSKLKDIKKKEGELSKLNGKLKPGLFNKPSAEKTSEMQLQIATKIAELQTVYEELEALRIKNTIYKYITPDSTILDVLKLASADYNFIVNTYKESDDTITNDLINQKLLILLLNTIGLLICL